MNIILDTNILITYPEILSKEKSGVTFHIPTVVKSELKNVNPQLSELLENLDNKSIKTQDFSIRPEKWEANEILKYGIADYAIKESAIYINSKYDNVKFASLDRELSESVSKSGVDTITLHELKEIIESKTTTEHKNTADEILSYRKKEKNKLLQGIAIGVIASIVASVIYQNIDSIIETINVWGTILAIIVLAFGIFLFRERYRLAYGIAELSIGFIAVISIFYPNFNYETLNIDVVFGIKIFGSLYIMVRGQDNILKSLNGTTFGEKFTRRIKKKTSR